MQKKLMEVEQLELLQDLVMHPGWAVFQDLVFRGSAHRKGFRARCLEEVSRRVKQGELHQANYQQGLADACQEILVEEVKRVMKDLKGE